MDTFEISVELPVSAAQLYAAWLSSEEHSAFTSTETVIEPRVGGKYTAGDSYMQGKTLELDPSRRIVQSWRTVEFAPDAPDSEIKLTFAEVEGGAKLTLKHSGLQPGDGQKYKQGWEEFYFQPMRAYFAEVAK